MRSCSSHRTRTRSRDGSLTRLFPSAPSQGINSQIGGTCLQIMVGAIWPSFLKVENSMCVFAPTLFVARAPC